MKTCFKCSSELPFTEFYKHPAMGDGYLGKCKSCTKSDVAAREREKKKDPDWVVAEAERHRLKMRGIRASGKEVKISPEKRAEALLNHAEKYPQKTQARQALGNAVRDGKIIRKPCEVCGNTDSEGHHDDYSKPLDVIWLCPKHHAECHVELNNIRRRAKAVALAS
jgi:hypothetical protein